MSEKVNVTRYRYHVTDVLMAMFAGVVVGVGMLNWAWLVAIPLLLFVLVPDKWWVQRHPEPGDRG